MRILVVEDDPDYLKVLRHALTQIGDVEIEAARSRDSARTILENAVFDVVLCDLKIPTEDDGLDKEIEHGIAVVTRARSVLPGTLVLVHSAHTHKEMIRNHLREAPRKDLTGRGQEESLVDFIDKGNLPECVERIGQYKEQIEELSEIAVGTGVAHIELSEHEGRLLRIFARRQEGSVVRVSELGGGMSAARVFGIQVRGSQGEMQGLAVAKVADLQKIQNEEDNYREFVAPLLRNRTYATLIDRVKGGAGHLGALFYGISEGSTSLLSVLNDSPERVYDILGYLQEELARWHEERPTDHVQISRIRQRVVSDDDMARLADSHLGGIDWQNFESQEIQFRRVIQHGDLHGENILVEEGRPLLIDFGEIHSGVASLDPLTLELSLLFHPEGREISGSWPSAENAETWHRLDEYISGCPVENFVRACREWAFDVQENDRAIYANLYVHAVRQLQYSDTDNELAVGLVRSALNGFAAT